MNNNNPDQEKYLSERLKRDLIKKEWQGNVRELRNFIRKSYYKFQGDVIDVSQEKSMLSSSPSDIKNNSLEALEKKHIIEALNVSKGNVVEASGYLDIGKSTLYRKIKKYDIDLKPYK